jgi:hypothetical protein
MRTTSIVRGPACLAMAALLAGACSKSASSDNTGGNGGGGTGGNGSIPAMGTCDSPSLEVLFSPMYSAYMEGGGKTFQIPAVVNGVSASSIKWSASDPSYVDMAPDPKSGGVMITTRKAGSVKIIASAGGLCGVSALTIASVTMDDWMIGSARYNSGIVLDRLPRGGTRANDGGAVAMEYACTNCHGDTATMGLYKTVSHTPEQTGGFSDDDLTNIFMNGTVPMGGYFDETVVPYDRWQGFHKWPMTPDQARGIIVYLRALTPQMQTGMRGDFGGRFGDGGRMRGDGGRMRGDGGRMNGDDGGGQEPPADAASTPEVDAASTSSD